MEVWLFASPASAPNHPSGTAGPQSLRAGASHLREKGLLSKASFLLVTGVTAILPSGQGLFEGGLSRREAQPWAWRSGNHNFCLLLPSRSCMEARASPSGVEMAWGRRVPYTGTHVKKHICLWEETHLDPIHCGQGAGGRFLSYTLVDVACFCLKFLG